MLQAPALPLALTSAVTGIVTSHVFQPEELATLGAMLLTVTQLNPVSLTVYVTETSSVALD